LTQVSELSHKLGSAQGSSQSLEQEVGQLRAQLKQLAGEKHGLEMQLSDTKAKLLALQEKVSSSGQDSRAHLSGFCRSKRSAV
jgi:spindle assembly abnormal protein 6